MRMLTACLALVVALAAGGIASAATDVIRGSATYRERMALPPGTTLEVELLDVSKADAPAVVIASESVPVVRQVPVPFSVSYDPATIVQDNRYALTARLVKDGATLFRSTATTPVLTQGAGETAQILLVQMPEPAADGAAEKAAEPAAPAAPAATVPVDMAAVAGTWIAEEINGAPSGEKVVSWLKLGDEGRAQGQGGCNSYTGTYKLEDGVLTFGPLASTRRACPEPQMSQEDRFFAALGAVKAVRIEDGKLVLADQQGNPLVRLRKK